MSGKVALAAKARKPTNSAYSTKSCPRLSTISLRSRARTPNLFLRGILPSVKEVPAFHNSIRVPFWVAGYTVGPASQPLLRFMPLGLPIYRYT